MEGRFFDNGKKPSIFGSGEEWVWCEESLLLKRRRQKKEKTKMAIFTQTSAQSH
jgi:hypothetical protein